MNHNLHINLHKPKILIMVDKHHKKPKIYAQQIYLYIYMPVNKHGNKIHDSLNAMDHRSRHLRGDPRSASSKPMCGARPAL